MEPTSTISTEQQSGGILETKSLAAALPDSKSPDQRPKYVQILQENSGQRSNLPSSPLNVSGLSAPPSLAEPATKPDAKARNNNNNNNKNKKSFAPSGKRPFKVYLKKQEVVTLPSTVAVREMEISPENVLFFSGPTHYLSALYPVKIIVDGNHYNSVEHYYQACKLFTLVGKETASELKSATTPIEVKKVTKNILKGKATPKQVAEWKARDSFLVLKHAIMQKFTQHEDLKNALLETGDKILIQTYLGDNFFAAGANVKYTTNWVNRHLNQSIKLPVEISAENFQFLPMVSNGKNAFGWILMSVRNELRAQTL